VLSYRKAEKTQAKKLCFLDFSTGLGDEMNIHKSAEDYLEAMLMLKEERGYVRSIDVAEKLGVTKPSVSYATKRLRESGFITFDPAGMIVLLEPGLEIAERMYERHKLLTELLIGLGVSAETAREDACKIEHDLSVESFDAIRAHAIAHR
jgi:Mn-dependent DtxR family transcriptional regulator